MERVICCIRYVRHTVAVYVSKPAQLIPIAATNKPLVVALYRPLDVDEEATIGARNEAFPVWRPPTGMVDLSIVIYVTNGDGEVVRETGASG